MQRISRFGKLLMIVLLAALLVAGIAVCATTALVGGETPGTAYADTQIVGEDIDVIKQSWTFGSTIICVIPTDSSGVLAVNDVYLGNTKINNPLGQGGTDHTAYGKYALEHVTGRNEKYVIYRWESESMWHLSKVSWRSAQQGDFYLTAPSPNRPATEKVYIWNIVNGFPTMFRDSAGNVYISPDGNPASGTTKFYISPNGVGTTPTGHFNFGVEVDRTLEDYTQTVYSTEFTGEAIMHPLLKEYMRFLQFEGDGYIATDPGTYFFSVTPAQGYCWRDGSRTKRTVVWTIKPVSLYIASVQVDDIHFTDLSSDPVPPTVRVTYKGKSIDPKNYTVDYLYVLYPGLCYATITPTKGGCFDGSAAKTIPFNAIMDLESDPTLSYDYYDIVYMDSEQLIEPYLHVNVQGGELERPCYTVEYIDSNVNAGQVRFSVKGVEPYVNFTVQGEFTIKPQDERLVSAIPVQTDIPYSGEEEELKFSTVNSYSFTAENYTRELIYGVDYTITYDEDVRINPGEYHATMKFSGNYTGEKKFTFRIVANLADAALTLDNADGFTYSGVPYTPNVTSVKINGFDVPKPNGADWIITYSDNINAGVASVSLSVEGNNCYVGAATQTFTIAKKHLEDGAASVENQDDLVYIGDEIKPVIIKDGETDVTEQFDITYTDNTNAGAATYTATAKENSNYTGEFSGEFTIKKAIISADSLETYIRHNPEKLRTAVDVDEPMTFILTDGISLTLKEESKYGGAVTFENNKLALTSIPETGIIASQPIKFTIGTSDNFSLAEDVDTIYQVNWEFTEGFLVTDGAKKTVYPTLAAALKAANDATENDVTIEIKTSEDGLTHALEAEFESVTLSGGKNITVKAADGGNAVVRVQATGIDKPYVTLGSGSLKFEGVTLQGTDGSEGNYSATFASVSGGTLEFTDGTVSGFAGAITASAGNITASGTTFSGNTATNGGAIKAEGATLTLTNCTFSGNEAKATEANTGLGGAIYAKDTQLSVSGGTFDGNTATNGGAIYIENTESEDKNIALNGGEYKQNEATDGGAIYIKGATATIGGNSTFKSNSAKASEGKGGLGGAIYVDNSSAEGKALTVTSGEFTKNSAEQGGAIYFAGSGATAQLVIGEGSESKPQFSSNLAEQNGGAIYAASGTTEVKAATASNNSAKSGIGDGIYLSGNLESAEGSANLTLNVNSADTDGFKDGIGVDGLSTITVNGTIEGRANKLTVEFGDKLIQAAGDNEDANHTTVAEHKFVTSDESSDETQLKANFRVANPGYTFDPKNEGGSFLAVTSTGDMFVYVQTTEGTYQGFNSIEQALEAAKSATDKTLYFTVNITYKDSAITNVTFEQEIDKTLTIPADSDVTLKTLVRVANRTSNGSTEYFTDDTAGEQIADLLAALNTDLKTYFDLLTTAEKPEWYDQSESSVGERKSWDFVVKRGEGFNGELLKVEQGATATINDVIFDGGAVWSDGQPAISDDGKGGAGQVTTNNTGLTAHAPAIVNQGELTLRAGCVVRNNDNNYAMPGDGFGSQYYGGGVRNEGKGQLTVDGAIIIKNYAREGGGILNINKEGTNGYYEGGNPTVTVKSGTIANNASQMKGAAVQTIYGGATTTVEGGTVENNFSLWDLGTLSVEEGGTLNVTGGAISAGEVAVGGDKADNNDEQNDKQNKYAIYVYNSYSEGDVASAATTPYVEGKAAAKLSVSGNPTLGIEGNATAEKGGAIYVDKDVDVAGKQDAHFAPFADLSNYTGTNNIQVDVSKDRGYTDGQPFAKDPHNKATFAFDEAPVNTETSKKFIFRTADGDVKLGGFDFAYEQTAPGKVTVFGTIAPDLTLTANIGGTEATITGGDNGEFRQETEISRDAEASGKYTASGTLTVNGTVEGEGNYDLEETPVYVLFFDPTTADISGVTDGDTVKTFYKDKNGEFKQLTDGVLPNDIQIDEDGNATFRIGATSEEAADERTITLGKRATSPAPTQPALTDLTDTTATFEGETGLEYALKDSEGNFVTDEDGRVKWVMPDDNGKVAFEGLTANSQYGIVARAQAGEGTIPGEMSEEYADAATTLTEDVATAKAAFETAYEKATASGANTEDIRTALDSYDALDKTADSSAATSLKHIGDKKAELESKLVSEWREEHGDALSAAEAGELPTTFAEVSELLAKVEKALSANSDLKKVGETEDIDGYFESETAQDVANLEKFKEDLKSGAKAIALKGLDEEKAKLFEKFNAQISHLGSDEQTAALEIYQSAMDSAYLSAAANINDSEFPGGTSGGVPTEDALAEGREELWRAHVLASIKEHYDEIVAAYEANGLPPYSASIDEVYNAQVGTLNAVDATGKTLEESFEGPLGDALLALDREEAKQIIDAFLLPGDSDEVKEYAENAKTQIDGLSTAEEIDAKVEETKLHIARSRALAAIESGREEIESSIDADDNHKEGKVKAAGDILDAAKDDVNAETDISALDGIAQQAIEDARAAVEGYDREKFETDHSDILGKTTESVTEDDLNDINDALDDLAQNYIVESQDDMDDLRDDLLNKKKAAIKDMLDKLAGASEVAKKLTEDLKKSIDDLSVDGGTEEDYSVNLSLDNIAENAPSQYEREKMYEQFPSIKDDFDSIDPSKVDELKQAKEYFDNLSDDQKVDLNNDAFVDGYEDFAQKLEDYIAKAEFEAYKEELKGQLDTFAGDSESAKAAAATAKQAIDDVQYFSNKETDAPTLDEQKETLKSEKYDSNAASVLEKKFKEGNPVVAKQLADVTKDDFTALENAKKAYADIEESLKSDNDAFNAFVNKFNAEAEAEGYESYTQKLEDMLAKAEFEAYKEELKGQLDTLAGDSESAKAAAATGKQDIGGVAYKSVTEENAPALEAQKQTLKSEKYDQNAAKVAEGKYKDENPVVKKQLADVTKDDKADIQSAIDDLAVAREALTDTAVKEKFNELLNAEAAEEEYASYDEKLKDMLAKAELEDFKHKHPVFGKAFAELTPADKQDIEDAAKDLEEFLNGLDDDIKAKVEAQLDAEAKSGDTKYDSVEDMLADMSGKAEFEAYREQLLAQLEQKAQEEGSGDNVNAALKDAKDDLSGVAYEPETSHSDNHLDSQKAKLDAVYSTGEDLLEHAGDKDDIVAALNADVQSKKDSGEYSEAQVKALEDIVTEAKAKMDEVTAQDVKPHAGEANVVENAKSKLDDIKNDALGKLGDSDKTSATTDGIDVQGNVEDGAQENAGGLLGIVTNDSGIKGGTTLHVDEVDRDTQKRIDEAISKGKFRAADGSNLSEDEMKKAVKGKKITLTLDIYLLKAGARIEEFNGTYKIKLLLTDELKNRIGLQVVYLNSETGALEVFKTTISEEGGKTYMEFDTTHFSDFYIMSEPTLNLWWLIILLALILAIECVAIVVIALKKRNKNNQNKTYVSVLPALLLGAIIVPSPAVTVCAVLGALIVVATAVIAAMLILKNKAKNEAQEPLPVEEPVEEEPIEQKDFTNSVEGEAIEETATEHTPSQPKPQEEVIEEQAPAQESIDEEEEIGYLTNFEETGEASGRAYDAKRHLFVLVRYDRSYTSRLIQSDDKTKSYYDEIKSELVSYKGVKSRISWRHENFRIGRERVAKLQFRGKKLCLYLPLDPNDYIDSKYKIEDFSDVVKNKEVPLAYLIKNDLRARYAKELIAIVMARLGAEKISDEVTNFSNDYPYDTLESLIGRKLIKVLMSEQEFEDAAADMEENSAPLKPSEVVREVKAESVKKMISDERATHLIEESVRFADRTRTGFVNVDVLSRNFEAGEYVTLDEMKKRIKGFDKRMTFVKVLARGILDKPLTVEGDDFSIDAAKMILLTGGKVIKTRRR